jgi:dipeptidase
MSRVLSTASRAVFAELIFLAGVVSPLWGGGPRLSVPASQEAPAARGVDDPGGPPPAKSIAIYVGRNLTADGSVLLGGFGHEPSSHWYEVTPRRNFSPGTAIEVGVTEEARIPGRRLAVPQVRQTFRFITTNYSEFAGFPPPLTNGGLNEHQVAARDVWSPSRPELVAMTPRPQTGLNYSDLARMAMERARSAREAAEIVGGLVDEHGYATYGGNSHLFADPAEGWVLIEFAGGQGLWAAQRLGPDEVRVLYPGYIGDFPLEYADDPDYMGSDNLVSFAVERGWWDPESGEPFNLHRVYGRTFPSAPSRDDPHNLFRFPPRLEDEIETMAPVSLPDMMALVRDPRWSNDGSGYGQVAHLREGLPPRLGVLWMSITGAVASPFVPVFLGVEGVPAEYKQHRYMTKDADRAFLDQEFAPLEGTLSAFRVHKRLLYHTCSHPEIFLEPVTADLEAFETFLLEEQADLEREVRSLLSAEKPDSAVSVLTRYTNRRLLDALELGEVLVARVEERTRERFGIRMPDVEVPTGATWRPESQPMTRREGRTYHRCFVEGFEEYPRAHGSYRSSAADSLARSLPRRGTQKGSDGGSGGPILAGGLLLGLFGAGLGWMAGRRSGKNRG